MMQISQLTYRYFATFILFSNAFLMGACDQSTERPSGDERIVVSMELPGSNCPEGGVRIVSPGGIAYVCNGEAGAPGTVGGVGPQGPVGPSAASAIVAADGSGDFTSLSAAVDSGAKSILVRNGTYNNTTNIDIGDGTLVRGETVGGVILEFVGPGARISGGSNNRIENMTITKSGDDFYSAIDFSGSGNIVADTEITSPRCLRTGTDCLVTDNSMEGVVILEWGDDCRIRGNSFRSATVNNGGAFIGGTTAEFTHNSFYMGNASGFGLAGGSDSLIAYNRFESIGNANGIAISANSGRIIGNSIIGFSTGISFSADSGIGGVVQGNVIRDSVVGIDVFGATNAGFGFIVVSGNSIIGPTTYGINLRGMKMTVTGNAVYGAGSHCIFGENSLQWVTIASNVGQGCGGSTVDVTNGFNFSAQTANVGDSP